MTYVIAITLLTVKVLDDLSILQRPVAGDGVGTHREIGR
jgi:hypothetical protein